MSDCGCGKGTASCQTNQKILIFFASALALFAINFFPVHPILSSLLILTSSSTVLYYFYGDTILEFVDNIDFYDFFTNADISDTSNKKEELAGETVQNIEPDQ